MHKNLWIAESGGRSFFFIETVQLAQSHPWVIDVHDKLKKTRVSLFESSELGNKAQL